MLRRAGLPRQWIEDPDQYAEKGRWQPAWARAIFGKRADGGRLTADERNNLPEKDFALPGRRYPINDASHARNALARVSQHGTPAEKSKVRAAVRRKYPDIGDA